MTTQVDRVTYDRNRRAAELKYFNECKNNFCNDNKEVIADMFASIVMGTPPIEILEGPGKGMVIKTSNDIHKWIDKQVQYMVG